MSMKRFNFKNQKYNIDRSETATTTRKNNLPSGRCGRCGNYDEALLPDYFRLCKSCIQHALNNSGNGINVIEADICGDYPIRICDWCQQPKIMGWKVNPFLCEKCLRKMGRRDTYTFKHGDD